MQQYSHLFTDISLDPETALHSTRSVASLCGDNEEFRVAHCTPSPLIPRSQRSVAYWFAATSCVDCFRLRAYSKFADWSDYRASLLRAVFADLRLPCAAAILCCSERCSLKLEM
jgi:hypothetical protein